MNELSAFKYKINQTVVTTIADEISQVYSSFSKNDFIKVSSDLDSLELKQRVLLITDSLKKHLPTDYLKSVTIICRVLDSNKLEGFALWPFSEYIAQYGLNHFDESMKAMYLLTQKFTSEFAIRPFFLKDHKRVLQFLKKWAKDKNPHVRRLVSEGSRPLLPWGMKLPQFLDSPFPTLILLEKLKFDEELYVRKSVANHLNDLSKHHPIKVIETLRNWENQCPSKHFKKISWIKKHALRTLIKKGHPQALKLMGVKTDAKITMSDLSLKKNVIHVGGVLEFSFELTSTAKTKQNIVIDYLIHFVKANQKTKAKIYKLKSTIINPGEKITVQKKHSLRKITTMTYYNGEHLISVQLNGKILATQKWILKT